MGDNLEPGALGAWRDPQWVPRHDRITPATGDREW
ncbi:hypothetical protein FBY37_1041 [Streptomyces sp. SLBN-134]|nr:hypothetical protein FBY37_1041 [Streptomyces sp. SLBN-134]